jgi:hypothetical protein
VCVCGGVNRDAGGEDPAARVKGGGCLKQGCFAQLMMHRVKGQPSKRLLQEGGCELGKTVVNAGGGGLQNTTSCTRVG